VSVDLHHVFTWCAKDTGVVDDAVEDRDRLDQFTKLFDIPNLEPMWHNPIVLPRCGSVPRGGVHVPSSCEVRVDQTKTYAPARPDDEYHRHGFRWCVESV
jgi:hypothetical protein